MPEPRHPYDPNATPWNAGTPWSPDAVRDLRAAWLAGAGIKEIAMFLQREESDVRAKMAELGIPPGTE